jgi:GDP-L-fucose synthase
LGFEQELDLRNQQAVKILWLPKTGVIIDAAAKVGGILANNDYQFIMENMQIHNLIDTALQSGVEVYFLGSSCIYQN